MIDYTNDHFASHLVYQVRKHHMDEYMEIINSPQIYALKHRDISGVIVDEICIRNDGNGWLDTTVNGLSVLEFVAAKSEVEDVKTILRFRELMTQIDAALRANTDGATKALLLSLREVLIHFAPKP